MTIAAGGKYYFCFSKINRSNTKNKYLLQKKNSICKIIVSGLLAVAAPLIGMAQQVCGNKPWSVRIVAESEMVRCPESWHWIFRICLKWDYCHGLELQAMLDV